MKRHNRDMTDLMMAWVEQEIENAPVWSEELAREIAEEEFNDIIKAHDVQVIKTHLKARS